MRVHTLPPCPALAHSAQLSLQPPEVTPDQSRPDGCAASHVPATGLANCWTIGAGIEMGEEFPPEELLLPAITVMSPLVRKPSHTRTAPRLVTVTVTGAALATLQRLVAMPVDAHDEPPTEAVPESLTRYTVEPPVLVKVYVSFTAPDRLLPERVVPFQVTVPKLVEACTGPAASTTRPTPTATAPNIATTCRTADSFAHLVSSEDTCRFRPQRLDIRVSQPRMTFGYLGPTVGG